MRGRRLVPVRSPRIHAPALPPAPRRARGGGGPARLRLGAGPCCPCTVFAPSDAPGGDAATDAPLELGMRFQLRRGRLHHRAALLQAAQQHGPPRRPPVGGRRHQLAEIEFQDETPRAGRTPALAVPVAITAGHDLRRLLSLERGPLRLHARATSPRPRDPAPLTAPADGNGVYRYGVSGFPDSSWNATNYWVDATFERTPPGDTRAPRVEPVHARRPAPTTSRSPRRSPRRFDEAARPRLGHRPGLRAARRLRRARPAIGRLRRGHREGDADAGRPVSARRRPTPRRSRAARRGVKDVGRQPAGRRRQWTLHAAARACPCTVFEPARRAARRRHRRTRRSRSA